MHVLQSLENGVLTVTLNRPEKLNALTFEMVLELAQAVEEGHANPYARVLVITGAGRGFCAGQDLAAIGVSGDGPENAGPGNASPGNAGPRNIEATIGQTYNRLILAIANGDKPVITAVNGIAAGAGANLALAGDIRVWSSAARFTEAFSSIALIPDAGGTWLLPRAVGYPKAFELAALAEVLDAKAGLELGLCERVFDAENFALEVQAYAEKIAARPAYALTLTKRAMRSGQTLTLEQSLALEARLQAQAFEDPDHKEGIAAFFEKRGAVFGKG